MTRMEFVHAGGLLEELKSLIRARQWKIILEERCDCGEFSVKHFDGGNYHRRCIIVPITRRSEIAVTFGSTCVIEPKHECDYCGCRVGEHDRHEHFRLQELTTVVTQAMQWVGTGFAEVWDDEHETVRVYEIQAGGDTYATEANY